jgi:hypothetical protein
MKTIKLFSQFTATAFLLGLFSVFASGQSSPVVNTSSTSNDLVMSGNVETTVQLTISTKAGGASVTGSNTSFAINLGNMNARGQGDAATGVTKAVDGTGYRYTSPIEITPVFTGLAGTEVARLKVHVVAGTDADIALEGATSGGASTPVVGTPTNSGDTLTSGTAVTRYVGFNVSRTEAHGSKSATLVYTLSIDAN